MKLSTLLEIIGSGSILLLVGVAILMLGICYGVSEATQLPLWACLCGTGLILGVAGILFLDRGSEEAQEQVKAIPLMHRAFQNPAVIAGASILGGLILQRIFRSSRREEEPSVVVVESPTHLTHVEQSEKPAPSSSSSSFSLSKYIGGQLRSLGAMAGGIALSTAVKSLGIPSMEQLVQDFTGGGEKKTEVDESNSAELARSRYDEDLPQNRAEPRAPVTASSSRPSHNGFNRPAPFDAGWQ